MNDYYRICSSLPASDYEASVAYLTEALEDYLISEYETVFDDAEIRHFNDNENRNYTLFFDCTDEEGTDPAGRAARVIFILARAATAGAPRDRNRLRNFLGSFKDIPGLQDYDKGHFIAHCNDGQLDQNIYPQLKALNRGLSPQGKLFRSMERYCQQNPGIFYFVRPVYKDPTWVPDQIDFGIFTREGGLLINRFDNRADQAN